MNLEQPKLSSLADQLIRKVNILMVDDHSDSLIALESVLTSPQFQLVKAKSGEEALRALLKTNFALILLDVNLPDMSGFEIVQLIRDRDRNRHVPIILITGESTDNASILKGYRAGAVDYMMKPINPDILRVKSTFFIDLYVKAESLRQAGK